MSARMLAVRDPSNTPHDNLNNGLVVKRVDSLFPDSRTSNSDTSRAGLSTGGSGQERRNSTGLSSGGELPLPTANEEDDEVVPHRSLCCFEVDNRFRRLCILLTRHIAFETIVTLLILVSCVTVAVDTPGDQSQTFTDVRSFSSDFPFSLFLEFPSSVCFVYRFCLDSTRR
jgi:hypothetical protein